MRVCGDKVRVLWEGGLMGRGQGFVGVVADVEIVVSPNACEGWGLGARCKWFAGSGA